MKAMGSCRVILPVAISELPKRFLCFVVKLVGLVVSIYPSWLLVSVCVVSISPRSWVDLNTGQPSGAWAARALPAPRCWGLSSCWTDTPRCESGSSLFWGTLLVRFEGKPKGTRISFGVP